MTAFVRDTTINGSSIIYSSAAINDSVTFLQGLTFFRTSGNAVSIQHGNNTAYNMATIMSGQGYGLTVNTVNDCEIVNTATGTIASLSVTIGDSAVFLSGDRNTLLNMGDIFSANGPGVTLQGDDSIIDNSGRIQGRDYGVLAAGVDYTILNSGTIESGAASTSVAVYLDGIGLSKALVNTGVIQSLATGGGTAVRAVGSNLTTIDNAGTIRSVSGNAIDANFHSGAIHLTNSGTITSSTLVTYSVVGTAQTDTILNTGTINRSVALGNGDDVFDGIGGFVGGTVFGGDGNDLFRISDPLAQVFENNGQGLLDRVESTVSFSLLPTGEVEDLTLMGTATDGTGNAYNNVITGNGMDNLVRAADGLDTVYGGAGDDSLFGDGASDQLHGGDGDDSLRGGIAGDTLIGGDGDDRLRGDAAGDRLYGDEGEDVLVGGAGRDMLFGGADADSFQFRSVADSAAGAALRDTILLFQTGVDLIDLTRIDANVILTGNQAFSFIGTAVFGNIAGQLRLAAGANSVLQGDVNGDGLADFELQLNGIATVSVNDLLL